MLFPQRIASSFFQTRFCENYFFFFFPPFFAAFFFFAAMG